MQINIVNIIIKIYGKVYRYFVKNVCTYFAKIYCKSKGIQLGENVIFYGLLFANVYQGSRIKFGDNTVFRSDYKGNAIGINHRIILRTQSSSAVIEIGNGSGMSGGAICAHKKVIIGKNTLIGANVVIADNDFHPIEPNERLNNSPKVISKEILIGDNVWIGADVYILKGVSIGDNTVIGAKSVVTKDVPANCIAAGNPVRIIRYNSQGPIEVQ